MARGRRKPDRPHKPAELGPALIRKGRWYSVDLRPWGGGRPTMRNPKAAGWPERGERTEDPEIADRWKWAYYDLCRGEHRQRVLEIPKDRSLQKAAEKYLEHRQSTMERATYLADRTALNHLLDRIGSRAQLATLEPSKVREMFAQMAREEYNATTLCTYAKSVAAFFRWSGFPVGSLPLPDRGEVDVRTLEPRECDQLREAASKVDRLQIGNFPSARMAVELGLSMGLRQGEIFALRWEAIDAAHHSVRVQWQIPKEGTVPKPLKGKLARSALVLQEWWPLHREAEGYIVGRNGKPVGTRTQRNLITRVLDTAGLNEVGAGWHLLRHTYARHFIERGGRLEELQKGLGHRTIRTTEKSYAHFHEDVAVRLANERIYGVS